MALLTLRDEKGIPLTHQEMDANLRNLNAEGVTGGNAHDHTTGNGAPIPYNSLTGKPTLGTAATANVTTSATDTTAGRLLKVGDFGLGGMYSTPWLDNLDLNNITTAGRYPIGLGCTNTPIAGYGVLEVIKSADNSYYYQTIHEITGNFYSHHRNYTPATSWLPWRQIKDSGNILASGVPAQSLANGAIIERGSNANGEYVKFADGTLICKASYSGGISLSTYATGLNIGPVSIAAPHNSVDGFAISVGGVDQDSGGFCSDSSQFTNSTIAFNYFTKSSTVTATYINVVAIGRWY